MLTIHIKHNSLEIKGRMIEDVIQILDKNNIEYVWSIGKIVINKEHSFDSLYLLSLKYDIELI